MLDAPPVLASSSLLPLAPPLASLSSRASSPPPASSSPESSLLASSSPPLTPSSLLASLSQHRVHELLASQERLLNWLRVAQEVAQNNDFSDQGHEPQLPPPNPMCGYPVEVKKNSVPFPRLAPSPPASTLPPVLSSSPLPSLVLHAPRYQSDEFPKSNYDIGHLPFVPLPQFAQQDLPFFPDLSEVPYNPVVGNVHSSMLGLSGMTDLNHLQTDWWVRRAPLLFEHVGPSNFVDPSAHADDDLLLQCSPVVLSDMGIWWLEKALDEFGSVLAPAKQFSLGRSVNWQAKARRERWRRPKLIEVWA
ncbi:hypothetical protein GGI18_004532 [Coemansia linderi]|uniref:Uncharacterized protein n=1 Tax=Coemansia linderi TaxID=2663919 RepID=A0ACC1K6V8_9FUNG|nr:hypothetical protein GGI18_004532 [Coemansia linderi]